MSVGAPRPRILLLLPGPQYDLEARLGARLRGLAQWFDGAVIAFAETPERRTIGGFDVLALPYDQSARFSSIGEMVNAAVTLSNPQSGRRPFDLVVTYDALKTGLAGWRICRRTGARLVVELNGDCFAWANYAEIDSPVKRWLERSSFILITAFVLSRANGVRILYAKQIKGFRGLLKKAIVRCFPDFVDLTHFSNKGARPEILLVGFPFIVKGVDILIDAFKRVAAQHPQWTVTILGWYPDPSMIMQAIGGHPRIRLHPAVPHREMPDHIGQCGMYVLASRTEGLPRVLMEAAMSGKARIASRVGAVEDIIRDDVDGLLFESGNVQELADLLDRTMRDDALRSRLGQAAEKRAREEYSVSALLEHARAFYFDVLAQTV